MGGVGLRDFDFFLGVSLKLQLNLSPQILALFALQLPLEVHSFEVVAGNMGWGPASLNQEVVVLISFHPLMVDDFFQFDSFGLGLQHPPNEVLDSIADIGRTEESRPDTLAVPLPEPGLVTLGDVAVALPEEVAVLLR